MYVSGIRSGTLCRVFLRDRGGQPVSAGTFRYRCGADSEALLSSALDLSQTAAVGVRAGGRTYVRGARRGRGARGIASFWGAADQDDGRGARRPRSDRWDESRISASSRAESSPGSSRGGASASRSEKAHSHPGAPREPVSPVVPSIATQTSRASGTSSARRPTPLRARSTCPRERVPSGKTPMQEPRAAPRSPGPAPPRRRRRARSGSGPSRSAPGQAAHLPKRGFCQRLDLAAPERRDADHHRVPVAVVVADQQHRAARRAGPRRPPPAADPRRRPAG